MAVDIHLIINPILNIVEFPKLHDYLHIKITHYEIFKISKILVIGIK